MTRTRWAMAAVTVLVVAVVGAGVIVLSGDERSTAAARDTPLSTAKVVRGRLSAMVSQAGTLTYRARPDGTPYAVVNRASGVYTTLPAIGDRVGCGGVLYRVDARPVVLLCGTVPIYRALHVGMRGADVRQLNRNLHSLGYDAGAGVRIDPGADVFTAKTEQALRVLQRRKGVGVTGRLAIDDAVFAPEAVRVAKVTGQVGGSARPDAPVLSATSDTLHVELNLDPSQQGEVKRGDRAQITLPGNRPVAGRVAGFGRVAQSPPDQRDQPAAATIPTFISLDDPAAAGGLDQAPVEVDITTKGVEDALSVPVTALVGRSGGGFAVEVVRAGGRRELVAVKLGLFDTGGGRVQVQGRLSRGDVVVVPAT